MKSLNDLPNVTEEMLGGLQADTRLLAKIRADARGHQTHRFSFKPVLAVACALAVCAASLSAAGVWNRSPGESKLPKVKTMSAGDATTKNGEYLALNLQTGSITLSSGNKSPSYRSIWAPTSGGNFPLIAVEGRYYRLLTNPSSVSAGLLGNKLGVVDLYTDEPSTKGNQGIMSNAAAEGTAVYAVSGMSGAMVAAEINGVTRVFQRVSYVGNALRGSEGLADTLRASGVEGLEMTGVGTVTDRDVASELVAVLLANAFYQGAGSDTGSGSLLISLSNGLALQMGINGETLYACGAWACPEFFDAFKNAVGR